MKFLSFLKSPTFWKTVAHIAIIGGGSYVSFLSGTPLPLVISSGVNALLPSPMPSQSPVTTP